MTILAASDISAAPVLIFMGLGIVIAIVGHLWKSSMLVMAGLFILFLATAAMVVGAYTAFENDEVDPRPPCGETVKECEKEGER